MAEQQTQATAQDIVSTLRAMAESGGTLKDVRGFGDDNMEAIYTLAYNFYNQDKLDDARKAFRFLCFYDHREPRYWAGLGASLQLMRDYLGALDAYSQCARYDKGNPEPLLHVGECYLALGDLANAERVFGLAIEAAGKDAAQAKIKSRAETLQKAVRDRKAAAE